MQLPCINGTQSPHCPSPGTGGAHAWLGAAGSPTRSLLLAQNLASISQEGFCFKLLITVWPLGTSITSINVSILSLIHCVHFR